jgi:hypothetical protein
VKFSPYHSRVKSTWIYRPKTEIKGKEKLMIKDAIPFTKDPNTNNSTSTHDAGKKSSAMLPLPPDS